MKLVVVVSGIGIVRWNQSGERTVIALRAGDYLSFLIDVERGLRWGLGLKADPERQAAEILPAFPGSRVRNPRKPRPGSTETADLPTGGLA